MGDMFAGRRRSVARRHESQRWRRRFGKLAGWGGKEEALQKMDARRSRGGVRSCRHPTGARRRRVNKRSRAPGEEEVAVGWRAPVPE